MPKINAIKVWEGPSELDPSVIIMMVVTGLVKASSNDKTGDMLQTWIMLKDIPPHEAVKTGQDHAVCGDCLLRPSNREARLEAGLNRPCYVKAYQAPLSVWKAHKDKPVTSVEEARALCQGKKLRFGSYGDPGAMPEEAWAWAWSAHGGE